MKCRIDKGARQVLAPNSQPSQLFKELENLLGFEQALDVYSVTETEDFKIYQKSLNIKKVEVSLEQLTNYVNRLPKTKVEKSEIINLMQATDIVDSSELLTKLSKLPTKGLMIFTEQSLNRTGLFDKFEIDTILKSKDKQANLKNVISTLTNSEEFSIVPANLEKSQVIDKSGKIVKQEPLELKNPQPVYKIVGEELTQIKSEEIDRLVRVLDVRPNENLSRDIAFLNTMTPTSWSLGTQIKTILTAVEDSTIDNGIDLTGLADAYSSKTRVEILGMLESVERTLEGSQSPETFVTHWESFFDKQFEESRDIPDTDLIIKTDLGEGDMLNSYSLIKIGEDLFRKVPQRTLVELQTLAPNVVPDTSLNTDVETATKIAIYKELLGVQDYVPDVDTSKVEKFTGDYQYITQEFTSDFGKWLLQTKNPFFKISGKGIEFKNNSRKEDALASLPENIKEDLTQYSLLSKNLDMPLQAVETFRDEFQVERDSVANNPSQLPRYRGDVQLIGDMVAVKNIDNQYLNIDNISFEQIYKTGNATFYKPLITEASDLFSLNTSKPEVSQGTNMNVFTSIIEPARPTVFKELTERELESINKENFNC